MVVPLHDTLIQALSLAGQAGDTGWVNDGGVLVIENPAVGEIDFKRREFAVLGHVDVHGKIDRHCAFLLNASRECVRELHEADPLASRVSRHIELIYGTAGAEVIERRIGAFREEYLD